MQLLIRLEGVECVLQTPEIAPALLGAVERGPRPLRFTRGADCIELGPTGIGRGTLMGVTDTLIRRVVHPERGALPLEFDDVGARRVAHRRNAQPLGARHVLALHETTHTRGLRFEFLQSHDLVAQHAMPLRVVAQRQRGQLFRGLRESCGQLGPRVRHLRGLDQRVLNAQQPPLGRRQLHLQGATLLVHRVDGRRSDRKLFDALPVVVAIDPHRLDLLVEQVEDATIRRAERPATGRARRLFPEPLERIALLRQFSILPSQGVEARLSLLSVSRPGFALRVERPFHLGERAAQRGNLLLRIALQRRRGFETRGALGELGIVLGHRTHPFHQRLPSRVGRRQLLERFQFRAHRQQRQQRFT